MKVFHIKLLSVVGLFFVIQSGYTQELVNLKNLQNSKSELLQKIFSARHNETEKTIHAKRNTQGDLLNDRDYSPQRNYDGRAANDRYDRHHVGGRDRDSYHRELDTSRDYRKEESLDQKTHLHEGRHLESDRYGGSDHRNKHWPPHDRSDHHRDGGYQHSDRAHIVDEIRHDTKIYKSDENMDGRRNSYDLLKGTSKYEVNERRRSGEMFDKDRRHHHRHDSDPCVMDKPFVININSDCGGPSKGRFVHKFVIKPQAQSHNPNINPHQQQQHQHNNPYKSLPYQSPNSYMSRQQTPEPQADELIHNGQKDVSKSFLLICLLLNCLSLLI